MYPVFSGLFLGLLVGLRHAFEPDHIAAVSTMVARSPTKGAAARLGAWWGLGHTLALVAVCGALIAFGLSVPPHYESLFELIVGIMLIGMGGRALWLSVRASGPMARHTHSGVAHEHAGPSEHVHIGDRAFAWRPLVVGLIHGVAGSGALSAVVMADLPGNVARIGYISLFGLGSIAGMALLSGLAGDALSRFAHSTRVARGLSAATGLLALVVGAVWSSRAVPGL